MTQLGRPAGEAPGERSTGASPATTEIESGTPPDDFEAAFPALFLRAMRLAYRVLGDEAAAEDVAADTMVLAYARWDRVGSLPYRDGWILRVAGNLALKVARKRPLELPPSAPVNFEDLSTIRVALAQALQMLSRRQRDVVVLRFVAGLSEPEVAASLGISLGSVKTHARRGLSALRTRLGERREEAELAHA
jgi:RNA polymerase sigma-70 factor, ECF subfamily